MLKGIFMKSVVCNKKEIVPSKVVCIGRNFVEHIEELGNEMPSSMVIFLKPNSSVTNKLYTQEDEVHYEAEISFLVKDGKYGAVGFGLDLTKREIQSKLKKKGLPWERAKAFDNSAVFSEFVSFEKLDLLHVKLYINNKLVQDGGVELMIYKPNEILNEIKTFMSFEDGDIVMSGTPKGVGKVKNGDKFLGQIFEGDKLLVQSEWIVD